MYTPTLEEARKLMEEHNQEEFHRRHAETVSGVTLIPQCIGLGQGAGVAAAVCVKDGTTTHNVDIKKVQKILCTEQDVPLPRQENTDPALVRELEEYKYGTYTDAAKKCREKAGLDW